MTHQPRLGILGGTFDPIHLGHVSAAEAAGSALALDEILVVASHDPPHRRPGPRASSYHRFAMVALAIAESARLVASDLELVADGPSYTSTTLRRLLAQGFAPTQLFFITGGDAFAEIAAWNDYPSILDLGHFVVISRPGFPSDSMPARLPELAGRMQTVSAGEATRQQPATTWSARGTRVFLVDAATPEVSSTEIRRQASERHPLTGLVAPAVERYIYRHRLYAPETIHRGVW
jgi:nicotinate-nucleotide adenylyltransferase